MNDSDYLRYDARVMTISPLHIGTGRDLLLDYDYAVHDRKTWRLNEEETLQAHYSDDQRQLDALAQTPPAQLLRPDEFQLGSRLFRYVIQGQPRARAPGSALREQIKTPHDRPYLPGSSLKGCLRTVLAWHGWGALGLQPQREKLDERPKFAARIYEQTIFGRDPNHDLLRALLVGDSAPVDAAQLMLVNVKVLTARGEGSPIELEALKPETRFHVPIKIDTSLFSEWARGRDFRLGGAQEWLEHLVPIARAHAEERIRRQRAWFEKRGSGSPTDFYRGLEKLALKDNQFVIQLGWGGGWDSKTFASRLAGDEQFLEWLIVKYRMARGTRSLGDPFPRSRRAAMRVARSAGGDLVETAASPLGWVLVELREVKPK